MDEELRALSRRADGGDPADRERYELAALRAGLPVVRTTGLYQCRVEDGAHSYISWLRFYADGLVLVVGAWPNVTPADLARWFHRERAGRSEGIGEGRWTLDGPSLSFVDVSRTGRVEYEGTVEGEELVLRTHSHITDWRAELRYAWVPLPPVAP